MSRLRDLVQRFKDKKVLIIGDVMLDEYRFGQVSRISQEAPVPIIEIERSTYVLGGAANTAANVRSLGGRVCLLGVVGDDSSGKKISLTLEKNNIGKEGLVVDHRRPTTLKTRVMARNQQLFRIDRESKDLISSRIEKELLEKFKDLVDSVEVVVISDYSKGVVTPRLSQGIINQAGLKKIPVVVDPKGSVFSKYAGATIITPNKKEAHVASKMEIIDSETLLRSVETLFSLVKCEAVLLTRSEEGMSLMEKNKLGQIRDFPALAREVYDVSGAGDTVVAALALVLASGGSFAEAAEVANYAASIVVGKLGTATVTGEELVEVLK
jgi:D-beta-D-heptose 7-phosphate kinase/D-beta-D-heptose 1-phosphate adenosyltransferase